MSKELKINPRFEHFSPKKKDDETKELRSSLKERGFVGLPILTWHGFIVDGHNRYHMCQELGITISDDNIEEINLGNNSEEIDAIEWMASHHLSSKSLEPGEKLALMDSLKKEIQKDNEEKKDAESKKFYGNRYTSENLDRTPNGGESKKERDTWSDNQIAKKAGVGIGTVARYNQVMKSDNEDLKEKVKKGEVKIGTAYREIKKKETVKKENSNVESPSTYNEIANSYSGVQNSGHFGEYYQSEKTTDKEFTEQDLANALIDAKKKVNVLDNVNAKDEFDTFKDDVLSKIDTYYDRIFNRYNLKDKFTVDDKSYAEKSINVIIRKLETIKEEIKGE